MAERRMFTQKITESDAFLEMPVSSQALYFHYCMNADDDGFVKNPKRIARMVGASDDDLKILLTKRFVLPFESGVIVIKHWRMHNLLRKDRYNPSEYINEKSQLYLKENGSYTTDKTQGVNLMATKWQPNGNQMATQDRIGKDSIDKISIDDDRVVIIKKLFSNFILDEALNPEIDANVLAQKVDESDYLKGFEETKASWINKHYLEIVAGKYRTFVVNKNQPDFETRKYSKEEMNSAFDNIDDIDL